MFPYVAKDLFPDITFHSFLVQEIARNKSREFPDLVPFPLPVFEEYPRSLVPVTGKKIDSGLMGTDDRGGVDLNGIPKPLRIIEWTHLLFVNSPHCSTKWATGISGPSKISSGKGWLSELCGR